MGSRTAYQHRIHSVPRRVFPALWPVDFDYQEMEIIEDGMDFPIEESLMSIYEERQWHSYVTYVRLRGLSSDVRSERGSDAAWT
jgi:hypothetical protein